MNIESSKFYSQWDNALNPRLVAADLFKQSVSSLEDRRSYTVDVISYVISNDALLLEAQSYIKNISNKSDLEEYDYILKIFGDGDKKMFLYKGHVLQFCIVDRSTTITDYFPAHGESIIPEFAIFLSPEKIAKVSILMQNANGMSVRSVDFEPPIIDSLDLNYGTGFSSIHEKIVSKLNQKKSGILCFHGAPGTGKTSYIKHLTSIVNKEFIFIPVGLASELASPSFLSVLMNHKDSILVIEDAEKILQSREIDEHNSSTVASLLNIADGILGSILNIKVLCSYNADKSFIDKALLRKGRLMFDYTFTKLDVVSAQNMAAHLGKNDLNITEPMSLADIYNFEVETNFIPKVQAPLGFNFSVKK